MVTRMAVDDVYTRKHQSDYEGTVIVRHRLLRWLRVVNPTGADQRATASGGPRTDRGKDEDSTTEAAWRLGMQWTGNLPTTVKLVTVAGHARG